MKKALFLGGLVLLAFAVIFSACTYVYDLNNPPNKETETILSLAGPENLKAVNEQKGVITVTWDPVYDAAGYEVWRKTGETSAVKLNSPQNPLMTAGPNRYDDVISTTNLLVAGREYTYTVVAISSMSTSIPRSVEIIQNGTSSTTITPTANLPPQGSSVVSPVTGLEVKQETRPQDGTKVVRISWDKDDNPGVVYEGEFNGNHFNKDAVSLSPDGSKVVYDYTLNNLTPGEKYTAKVTAYYSTGYYPAAAAAESPAYTHEPTIFSDFSVSVEKSQGNGNYEISFSWNEKSGFTNVMYELYVREYTSSPSDYAAWTQVKSNVSPTASAINPKIFSLTDPLLPAYRRQWTYKLVAKADGKETSATADLKEAPPWSDAVITACTLAFDELNTLPFTAGQGTDLLVAKEQVEFYAVLKEYPGTATLLGSLSKEDLESADEDERAIPKAETSIPAGEYLIKVFVLNGTERTEVNYEVSSDTYGPSNKSYHSVTVSDEAEPD
ncbi:MAG: fibronectin type III domain-containing protein [Treponema sp.]|nr:fibronectin type III domain-containing protein [Treponema sp.]